MSGAPVTPWDGAPEHPERDGWHWVQNRYGAVVPALWIAEDGMWRLFNSDYSVKAAARNQTYLGPCMLPSDLAALHASHAEMRDMLQEAATQIEYLHGKFQPTGTGNTVIARIAVVLANAEALT